MAKSKKHYITQINDAESKVYANPENTIKKLNKIIDHATGFIEEHHIFKAHILIFWGYYIQQQISNAKSAVQKTIQKFDIHSSPDNYALIKLQQGLVAYEEGDNSNAIQFYTDALTLSEKLKNKRILSSLYSNLGAVYNINKNFEQAIAYFKKSISIKEMKQNKMEVGRAHLNIGVCYQELEEYSLASQYLKKALKDVKGIPEEIRISAYALNSLASISMVNGNLDEAKSFLQKGLKNTEIEFDPKVRADLLMGMGRLNFEQNNYKLGKDWIKQCIDLTREHKMKNKERDAYKFLSNYYEKESNYKQALENLKKSLKLNEEVLNEQYLEKLSKKEQAIEELTTRLNVIDLKSEDKELHDELESKEKELAAYLLKAINLNNELGKLKHPNDDDSVDSHSPSIHLDDLNEDGTNINWKEFETRFTNVHNDFFNTLQQEHPNLSNTEVILSALLKLRMRTKDISSLMNVQVDSYYWEAVWDIWDYQNNTFLLYPGFGFDYAYHNYSLGGVLTPGEYALFLWDDYGDGGVTGNVTDSQGNVLANIGWYGQYRFNDFTAPEGDFIDGDLHDNIMQLQTDHLNSVYNEFGYSFSIQSIDRLNNSGWYYAAGNKDWDTGQWQCEDMYLDMASNTSIDPAHTLNYYWTTGGGIYGLGVYPWSFPEDSHNHGLYCANFTHPGGAWGVNEGDTGLHEAGHYLGLYHTFENGCAAPGDEVDDTPPQAYDNLGCPSWASSCGVPEDIGNFMDYVDDDCMYFFTEGQKSRIHWAIETYRPSLLEATASTLPGDVNDDFTVDILDIVQIVGYIVGNNDLDDSVLGLADFNSDGNINVIDLVDIVNSILNT